MGKVSALLLVLVSVFSCVRARSEDQPAKKPAVDRYGDPLPDGAVARLGTLRWRQDHLSQIAFFPDGKSLLAGGNDLYRVRLPGPLRRWDVTTGKVLRQYGPAVAAPFALSADGKLLASQDTIRQAEDGKILFKLKGHGRFLLDVFTFSPKSDILAAASLGGSIFLWNASNGKLLRKFPAHIYDVPCLAFSPDGKWLASGAGRTGKVWLWNVADGKPVRVLSGHTEWVWSVAFSPNGKFLASVDSMTLKIWDPDTGKELHSRSRLQG